MKKILCFLAFSVAISCGVLDSLKDDKKVIEVAPIGWQESNATYFGDKNVSNAAIMARAKEVNAFGARLAKTLFQNPAQKDQGLLLSAYSIQSAFGILYPATAATDETELSDVLGFGAKLPFYESMRGLNEALTKGSGENDFELSVYNDIWTEQSLTLRPAYLQTIKEQFNGKAAVMNFANKADPSRVAINQYIESKTHGLIKELLPAGSVDSYTTAVLTNALYYKAAWLNEFDKDGTKPQVFHAVKGDKDWPFMNTKQMLASNLALDNRNYDAVSLPLTGNMHYMVLQSRTDDWRVVQNLMTNEDFWREDWDRVIGELQYSETVVQMPKFKLNSETSLLAPLKELGMETVFAPSAGNFSLMFQESLAQKINGVFHKTAMEVDEKGVVAAAATGIVNGTTSIPPPAEFTFIVDKPHLVVIYDTQTHTALFVGLVTDPS